MSSFPPPPSPPPPSPSTPPGAAPWSTPISTLTDPAPVSAQKSGIPVWVGIGVAVALLGAGAFALIALGGDDDDAGSATTIRLGGETTISAPDGSSPSGEVPSGVTGTRDSPVPVGQIADIGGDWRLQVLNVIPDASVEMAAGDEFAQPPPAGSTFMLVRLALGYFGPDDPKVGYEPDLAVLGSASIALDNFCLATVPDEADLFNYMFSGGVMVGNACFVAPLDEAGTFVLFGKGDFFADEGVYLELGSPSSPVQPMAALRGPQPGAKSTEARLHPAPVGATTAVGPDWQVTIAGAARDITAEVIAESEFNEPPPVGFHYVGVDVTLLYNGSASASPAQVSFGAVGDDNLHHYGNCGQVPGEIDLFPELFAGGRASGTMCMVVPDDGGTFTLFATSDFTEFVWFATS